MKPLIKQFAIQSIKCRSKNDLSASRRKVKKYCVDHNLENVEVIEDGSGLNFKKGFKNSFQ